MLPLPHDMKAFDGHDTSGKDVQAEPPAHYYGDIVRELFFTIGILMLVALPLFYNQIRMSAYTAVFSILIINVLAGFTTVNQRVSILFDLIVSLIGLFMFEMIAVFQFNAYNNFFDPYFLFNQILALIFFIALYYSTKTLRGMRR